MHLVSIIKYLEVIFFSIIALLLLNTLIIFTELSYLSYLNIYNNLIFNSAYILIFLILFIFYFYEIETENIKKNFLIFSLILLFLIIKLTYNFNYEFLKDLIQISIIYLLFNFFKKKIIYLKKFILISNIIIIFSIFLKMWSESLFFNQTLFYSLNFDYFGFYLETNLHSKNFLYMYASYFNHFNVIIFAFLIINLITKSYINSTFSAFVLITTIFYLMYFSNLYIQISTVILFSLYILEINYLNKNNHLEKKKKFTFLLKLFLFFIFLSPFLLTTKFFDNSLVSSMKVLDNHFLKTKNLPKIHCLDELELKIINKKTDKLNLQNNDIVCFGNPTFKYHLKSFRLRVKYQNKLKEELFKQKHFFIFGLEKEKLKQIYSYGYFPHNSFLDLLAKFGIIGLIIGFLCLIKLINSNKNIIISPLIILFFSMAFDDYLFGHMFTVSIILWITVNLSLMRHNYEKV